MSEIHPLLIRAKGLSEAFAVRPHGGGFVIWRWMGWDVEPKGWRSVAYASTRVSAEAQILARFPYLGEPEAKSEAPAPTADPIYGFGWF